MTKTSKSSESGCSESRPALLVDYYYYYYHHYTERVLELRLSPSSPSRDSESGPQWAPPARRRSHGSRLGLGLGPGRVQAQAALQLEVAASGGTVTSGDWDRDSRRVTEAA